MGDLEDESVSSSSSSDVEEEVAARDDQRATIAWVNTLLKQRGFKLKSLTTDLRDGVLLINLLEITFRTRIGPYNARPKQRLV
jgi:hypothetical protein